MLTKSVKDHKQFSFVYSEGVTVTFFVIDDTYEYFVSVDRLTDDNLNCRLQGGPIIPKTIRTVMSPAALDYYLTTFLHPELEESKPICQDDIYTEFTLSRDAVGDTFFSVADFEEKYCVELKVRS